MPGKAALPQPEGGQRLAAFAANEATPALSRGSLTAASAESTSSRVSRGQAARRTPQVSEEPVAFERQHEPRPAMTGRKMQSRVPLAEEAHPL